jgi:hypothetical protein
VIGITDVLTINPFVVMVIIMVFFVLHWFTFS